MNGAESLVRTLVAGGVDACFTKPGTSEMHFVAALDRVEGMRCVLGLFEGVVTGAADGYFRMKGTPASTLLHLGPGLANGLANLHNAKKARSGIVNVVGEHATTHLRFDPPLAADIAGIARTMSRMVRTASGAASIAPLTAEVIAAARDPAPAIAMLKPVRHIVAIDTGEPIAFFAYPGKPSRMQPEGCDVLELCGSEDDTLQALSDLASAVGARAADRLTQPAAERVRPSGAL